MDWLLLLAQGGSSYLNGLPVLLFQPEMVHIVAMIECIQSGLKMRNFEEE